MVVGLPTWPGSFLSSLVPVRRQIVFVHPLSADRLHEEEMTFRCQNAQDRRADPTRIPEIRFLFCLWQVGTFPNTCRLVARGGRYFAYVYVFIFSVDSFFHFFFF